MKRIIVTVLAIAMLLSACALAEGRIIPLPVDDTPGPEVNPAYFTAEWTYEDPSLSISIEKYPWEKTVCYVARVKVADPTQLRTASAYGFNRKQVASVQDMARRMNAVIAINGDYCYYQLSTVGSYLVRQGRVYAERMAEEAVLKAAGFGSGDELAQAAQGVRDSQVPPAAPKRDKLVETVDGVRRRLMQRKEARR